AAVLERHAKIPLSERDIYVNVGGGIKLSEVSIELPLALALYSAVTGKSLPASLVSMGELSLAGEVRPVSFGDKRIKGALSMGFDKLLVPSDLLKVEEKGLYGCDRIDEALKIVARMVGEES
ncbi:MAG: DNA repair protein RadA, partial [Spirochaetales bacterium]|nr:DNA repair protein RadA [Spirochaetales bacterium]